MFSDELAETVDEEGERGDVVVQTDELGAFVAASNEVGEAQLHLPDDPAHVTVVGGLNRELLLQVSGSGRHDGDEVGLRLNVHGKSLSVGLAWCL
jgi:hypothetical protein